MAETGRNDPCPCGSGKKFKKCCAAGEAVVVPDETRRALAMHNSDQQVVDEMLRWLKKRYGQEWFEETADGYFADFERHDYDIQLLLPWSLHHFEINGKT